MAWEPRRPSSPSPLSRPPRRRAGPPPAAQTAPPAPGALATRLPRKPPPRRSPPRTPASWLLLLDVQRPALHVLGQPRALHHHLPRIDELQERRRQHRQLEPPAVRVAHALAALL